MKTRNPSHQTSPGLEARSCFSPGSLPPVKTSFIIEAETVNTGTKFTIRDTTQQQLGDHIEKLLSWDRSKAEMRTQRERVWATPLVRRSAGNRPFRSFILGSSSGLCLPSGQFSGFFFYTWPALGPSPGVCINPSAKMDLEGARRLLAGARLIMAWQYPLTFDLQGALLHMCSVSLVPKDGEVEIS